MNLKKCARKFFILKLSLYLCIFLPAISMAKSAPDFKIEKQPTTERNPVENKSLLSKYSDLKDLKFSSDSADAERSKEKISRKPQGVSAELLSNNGFELGYVFGNDDHWYADRLNLDDNIWYENSNIIVENSSLAANGDWYAWLDYRDWLTSKEFTFPDNATSITLDYNAVFANSGCTTGSNAMGALLYDNTNNESVDFLDTFNANIDPSDSQYYNRIGTLSDLRPRAGHQMMLMFYGDKEQEACSMLLYLDDINLTATTTDNIYRFWSNQKQGHFFTISAAEKDSIIANDPSWSYEGVAYNAFSNQEPNSTAIYRFWSNQKRHHFFTASVAEKDSIIANDPSWAYEGIAYYAYTSGQSDRTAVYRFWSNQKQGHFFTISEAEKDSIIANDPSWAYEGIAWYVPI